MTLNRIIIPVGSFPLTEAAKAVEGINRAIIKANEKELVKLRGENTRLKEQVDYYLEKQRESNKYTKYNMQENFKSFVKENIFELLDYQHPQDLLHEWVDSEIPHSHWELLQYAASDYAFTEPDDPGTVEGITDIHQIIQWCCGEVLNEAAYEAIQEVKDEGFYEYMSCKWEAWYDTLFAKREAINDISSPYYKKVLAKQIDAIAKHEEYAILAQNLEEF